MYEVQEEDPKETEMITIKSSTGEIKRMSDEEARAMVKSGTWSFCPKSEWKKLQGKSKGSKVPDGKAATESSMSSASEKGGGKFRKEIPNDRKRDRRMEELGTKLPKPAKASKSDKPVSKYAEKRKAE